MKNFLSFIIISILYSLITSPVQARLLPRYSIVKSNTGYIAGRLTITPSLRGDRQALNVTFSNLNKVNSAFYTLMYQTNGKDEGVSGSIDASQGDSLTRELLFGTCSSGVCRYHQNLSNMKLEVTSDLPSGQRVLKRYRIRI